MPVRRRRLAAAALASALASALLATDVAPRPAGAQGAAPRPNVLIVMTDDQGPSDWPKVMPKTRRWFIRGGTKFTNAFVTTPLCCPSRGSIFTGRYAHNHGVIDNGTGGLLDQSTTIHRALQDAGYATAYVGKFLNGWLTEDPPPHFDRWATFSPTLFGPGYRNGLFNLDGQVQTVPRYSTDFIRDRGIGILKSFEQDDDRPWLLYLSPFAPHGPFKPAKRHRRAEVPRRRTHPGVGEADRSDKPPYVQAHQIKRRAANNIREKQLRTLMAVDDLVGKVMRVLGTLGERENTLAFFLSDNGFTWGEHGWADKRVPYTRSIRVPFLFRWPARVPPGGRSGNLVTNVDIPATIAEAAGLPADPGAPMDGRSLLTGAPRDRVFLEYWANDQSTVSTWRAIRSPRMHYIETFDDQSGEIVFREYYDLVSDPFQLTNLLADQDPSNDPPASEVLRLSQQIRRDAACRGVEGADACP